MSEVRSTTTSMETTTRSAWARALTSTTSTTPGPGAGISSTAKISNCLGENEVLVRRALLQVILLTASEASALGCGSTSPDPGTAAMPRAEALAACNAWCNELGAAPGCSAQTAAYCKGEVRPNSIDHHRRLRGKGPEQLSVHQH